MSSRPALISYRDRSPPWQRQARATRLHTSSKRRNQHKDTLDPRRLGPVSFECNPPSSPSWRR
ncbi:hypothetical protein [Nonomuraea sp. NPDC049625]|uniref:hypothetical protein n=1 Tax=Nonomuraea sp. NPDC049625 TaxID=3155775 RepID=UPI003419569C